MFDYPDPGTDDRYCDAISDDPHDDNDPHCDCDRCHEAKRWEADDEAE